MARRPAKPVAPTTPDPIEIAMEAESGNTSPDSPARGLLIDQRRLVGWQIASERMGVLLKGLIGLAGLVAAVALAVMAWSASQDRSLVFDSVGAPEDMAKQGSDGQALAHALQDKLARLQADTKSQFTTAQVRNKNAEQLKVQIPATGISIGELNQALRDWLGHQTHVSAEVSRAASGPEAGALVLAARVQGHPGMRLTDRDGNLDALLEAGAEQIYARVDPMRYAQWLQQHGRAPEALVILRGLTGAGADIDRAEALYVLTQFEGPDLGMEERRSRMAEIVRLSRGQVGLNNLAVIEGMLGHAEASYRGYVDAERRQKGRGIALTEEARTGDLLTARSNVGSMVGDYQAVLLNSCFAAGVSPCTGQALASAISQRPDILAVTNRSFSGAARSLVFQHDMESAAQLLAAPRTVQPTPAQQAAFDYGWLQAEIVYDWKREDWPAMLKAADAALALSTQYPSLTNYATGAVYRPLALAGLGDLAGAEGAAAATPADCQRCVLVRGDLASFRHDWAGADHWFAEALRLGPSLPNAEADWGAALLAQGKTDAAIARLKSANRKAPRFADPLELWGEALLAKGDGAGAASRFADADRIAPQWGRLHLKWGEALARAGKRDEAAVQYRKAAALFVTPAERADLARLQGAR